jgi:hypothetical protein
MSNIIKGRVNMNLQGTFWWLLTVLASVVSVARTPTMAKGDSVDYTLEAAGRS